MTTVAYDGKSMVADMLASDTWGMKEKAIKIWENPQLLIGAAGEGGAIQRWLMTLTNVTTLADLLTAGYAPYARDSNDPAILLVCRQQNLIYRHAGGSFMPTARKFHAVGSGRDYALAAMHLGLSAREAVGVAMEFDINTGGDLQEVAV